MLPWKGPNIPFDGVCQPTYNPNHANRHFSLGLKERPIAAVLLGYKKTGFGQGKFTGFGGKIETGESILSAAARELAEETGLQGPHEHLNPAAILAFRFPYKPEWSQEVYVFTTNFNGQEPVESDEMVPQWFPYEKIHYISMWADGRHWLPASWGESGSRLPSISTPITTR